MMIRLINLDRDIEKLARFHEQNKGVKDVQWERFSAVSGRDQNLEELAERGLIDPSIMKYYNAPNLGCALSHIALWNECLDRDEPLTICEDDAVFNNDFLARSSIALNGRDFDVAVWGWNFDAPLLIDMVPGIARGVMAFNQDDLRNNVHNFASQDIPCALFKLLQNYGTVCYTVSTRGADRLLKGVLPLRPFGLRYAGQPDRVINHIGIDIGMDSMYPEMDAYISIPPLVVTPNFKS